MRELAGSTTVVRAQASDVPAVEALLDASARWQRERGLDQWQPGTFEEEIRDVAAAGCLFVARRNEGIVG